MPVGSLCFRAVCGSFYWTFQIFMKKRAQRNAAMSRSAGLTLNTPIMAVIVVFLSTFLLQCGDVESNPGPDPRTRQTTLTQLKDCSPPTDEPTITDVFKMLTTMDQKMTTMDKKIDSIHATVEDQINMIRTEFEAVQKENRELKEKVDSLENKLDDLEGRSRRNNLIFHGIPRPQGQTETWADCEKAVKNALKEELGIDDDIQIERAHRLRSASKGGQPIIACFNSYKMREKILAERRALKNKRSPIFISEDFTPKVRDQRRKLLPFLKEAKNAGKKAFLRFDNIVIEGKSFVFDPVSENIKERQSQR